MTKAEEQQSRELVERFREEMPKIKVRFPDGTILDGITQGRKQEVCTVNVQVHGAWVSVGEWQWISIAKCHYSGKPVAV